MFRKKVNPTAVDLAPKRTSPRAAERVKYRVGRAIVDNAVVIAVVNDTLIAEWKKEGERLLSLSNTEFRAYVEESQEMEVTSKDLLYTRSVAISRFWLYGFVL